MSDYREAILLGIRGASEIHNELGVRSKLKSESHPVDVFGAIVSLRVPLLIRPLDQLLGAYVQGPEVGTGIVVTSRRDLHLQRFTAAHELGHFVLKHNGSLDREIPYRRSATGRDLREVAADAFAAEFLMPRWLCIKIARRHGWDTGKLSQPATVYQLSLRMAVSYEATCWALLSHSLLDRSTVDRLRLAQPKTIKRSLLGSASLDDPWADVWVLFESDDGWTLEAGPSDVFVTSLTERSGAGYLWENDTDWSDPTVNVADDLTATGSTGSVGGSQTRTLLIRTEGERSHRLRLIEHRPWERSGKAVAALQLTILSYGAEKEGLPRAARPSAGERLSA